MIESHPNILVGAACSIDPRYVVRERALKELAELMQGRDALVRLANRHKKILTPEYQQVMTLAADLVIQLVDLESQQVLHLIKANA